MGANASIGPSSLPIEVDHEMLRRLGGICYMRVKDCPAFNRVYSSPVYSRDEVLEEVARRGLGSATVLSQNVRHLRTSCAALEAAYKTLPAEERTKMEALIDPCDKTVVEDAESGERLFDRNFKQQAVDETPVKNMDELYASAKRALPVFQLLVKKVAGHAKISSKGYKVGVLKRRDRAVEKATRDYGVRRTVERWAAAKAEVAAQLARSQAHRDGVEAAGKKWGKGWKKELKRLDAALVVERRASGKLARDLAARGTCGAAWIFDAVRATIVVRNLDQLRAVWHRLTEGERNAEVIRVKNRLKLPVFNGYRDYLVNVRVRMNKGGSEGAWHTCELQVQLDPLVEAEAALDSLVAYEYFRDSPRTVLTMLLHCPEEALPDEAALNAPVRPSAVDKRRAQLEVALQNRGLRPSGFLSHDRETLQRCFDEEHDAEMAKWEANKKKREKDRAAKKKRQEEEAAAARRAAEEEEEKKEGKK